MSSEIDPNNFTLDGFLEAIANHNSTHQMEFLLSGSNDSYTLTGGDELYCSGSLQQCAFYWEGYVSGQGDDDYTIDD